MDPTCVLNMAELFNGRHFDDEIIVKTWIEEAGGRMTTFDGEPLYDPTFHFAAGLCQ